MQLFQVHNSRNYQNEELGSLHSFVRQHSVQDTWLWGWLRQFEDSTEDRWTDLHERFLQVCLWKQPIYAWKLGTYKCVIVDQLRLCKYPHILTIFLEINGILSGATTIVHCCETLLQERYYNWFLAWERRPERWCSNSSTKKVISTLPS